MDANERQTRIEAGRIGALGAIVLVIDQAAKLAVLRWLGPYEERLVLPGFFRIVHWQNTGAAFSMFPNFNGALAVISIAALAALWIFRRRFDSTRVWGRFALGLLCGGVAGNLVDRLLPTRRHVIDFLYFYLNPRGGGEVGFPAFNVADLAICVGVFVLILLSWHERPADRPQEPAPAPPLRS